MFGFFFVFVSVVSACTLLNNCNTDKGQGSCAADGVTCVCSAGFLGDSCSVQPAQLVVGTVVPGFVPLGGIAYFRVAVDDYNLNDQVVVEPTGDGTVLVYAAIGKVPSPDAAGVFTFQFKSSELEKRQTFTLSSLASLGGPMNQNLYVAVQAANVVKGNGVQFEVFHWSGKSDRIFGGVVDDWAVFACLALVALLCCGACALGIIASIASRGDDNVDDGAATALQKQRQAQEAEEKAKKLYGQDYPQQQQQRTTYGGSIGGGTFNGGSFNGGSFNGGSFNGANVGGGVVGGGSMSSYPQEYPGGGRTMASAISYQSGSYDAQW
jgi:hypothetical protein